MQVLGLKFNYEGKLKLNDYYIFFFVQQGEKFVCRDERTAQTILICLAFEINANVINADRFWPYTIFFYRVDEGNVAA